jgi:hypothetical protein
VLQNFQEECETKLLILEEATVSAQKMTSHKDADEKVSEPLKGFSHYIEMENKCFIGSGQGDLFLNVISSFTN